MFGRGWFRFDATAVQAVENAIANGQTRATSKFFNPRMQQNVDYEYHLDTMKQLNMATGFTRNIRRTPPIGQALPPNVAAAAANSPPAAAQGGAAAAGGGGGIPKAVIPHYVYTSPGVIQAVMMGMDPAMGYPFEVMAGGVAASKDVEVIRYSGPDAQEDTFEATTKFSHPTQEELEGHECPICMEPFDASAADPSKAPILMSECRGHFFHRGCLDHGHMFKNGCIVCPSCKKHYGVRTGVQPQGTMAIDGPNSQVKCAGFDVGTFTIKYEFPPGTQREGMPEPGRPYSGTARVAFIPATEEGKKVMEMHKVAFKRGLMFRVDTSITTGRRNTVVWGSVHHKTNIAGGVSAHGFPDDSYFERVKVELSDVGVSEDDGAA
uniref:RING-type E3 ubiquitin transferase n=1 Tax=Hemiselmis andersenii TaxID=464988 RepID=A0A7S1DDU0_HEMAN